MKAKKSTIRFTDLRKAFEKSDFEVILIDVKKLTSLSAKQSARKRATADNSILGLILPDESQIAINKGLPLEDKVKTLLHELVHLYDPKLTENQTEKAALTMFEDLSEEELGYLEFLAS